MADRIVLVFDGDAKGLIATVNGATKSISDFDKKTQQALLGVEKAFQGVGGSAQRSGAQLKAQNTNYMNFGRVIQDLPFGLIGIQNNLTQLIPSVGLLGLGFSVLVSALTFMQTGTDNWTRGLKGSASAIQNNLDLARKFNQELIAGNSQAKTEIGLLQSYVSVAKDENVTREGRLQAVKAINDIMPDLLGDIQLEGIYSDQTAAKIDKYTKSVFLNAKVKAASSLIEKEYTKQFEAQAKSIEDNASGIEKTGAVIGAAIVGIGAEFQALNYLDPFAALNVGATGAAKAIGVYNSSVKRIGQANFDKTISTSNVAINAFSKILNDTNKELANMGLLFTDVDKKSGKSLKSLADIAKELATDLKVNANQQDKNVYEKIVLDLDSYQKALDNIIKNGLEKETLAVDNLKKKYQELFNTLNNRGGNISDLADFSGAVRASDVTGGLTFKNATVDFTNAKTTLPPPDTKEFDNAVKNSIFNASNNILNSLNNIGEQGSSVFANLGNTIVHAFDDIFANQLSNAFHELATTASTSIKGLEFALAAMAGSIISGLGVAGKKGNVALKSVGGAVSGAAAGALAGSVVPGLGTALGAVIGGILGGASGFFTGSKQQKQAEIQKQQLAEAEKQTKLLERQNALAYTAQIIGRMTNQGIVTGVEVNEFGDLTTKIAGQDLEIILKRANRSRQRGT